MYIKSLSYIVLACALIVGLISYRLIETYDARLTTASVATANLSSSLAQYTRDVLTSTDTQIKILIDNYTLDHVNDLERQMRVMVRNDDTIDTLWLFDPRGDWIASSLDTERYHRLRLMNYADRAYFQYLKTHQTDAVIISVVRRKSDGQRSIVLARRISTADGSFSGVAAAALKPASFETFFQSFSIGRNGYIYLKTKDEGTILVQIGSVRDTSSYLSDSRDVPGFNSTIAVALETDEILKSWWYSVYISVFVMVCFLFVMGLLGQRLFAQVNARLAVEADLRQARELLEQRVADRTADLRATIVQRNNLLREVFHRVKNNMQVVDGLLYIKTQDFQATHALHEMRILIHVINLAHTYLMETEEYGTFDIAPFLIDLTNDVAAHLTGENCIDITVSSMYVDIDYAVPIGLLMTELMSICLDTKQEGDRLPVSLVLDADTVTITVGFASPARFETRLIICLLRQLNGVLDVNGSQVQVRLRNRVAVGRTPS